MAKRRRYHVFADGAEWIGRLEGEARASVRGKTKGYVVERTRGIAKNNRPSALIVHGQDDEIQHEWTYDKDPYLLPG